jgi:hypothetical protein
MESMTLLYAGVPVTDMPVSLAWFGVFFGRPADEVIDGEALWNSLSLAEAPVS